MAKNFVELVLISDGIEKPAYPSRVAIARLAAWGFHDEINRDKFGYNNFPNLTFVIILAFSETSALPMSTLVRYRGWR